MRREVLKRNSELDKDTARNFEWRLTRPRGYKKIRLVKKLYGREQNSDRGSQGRERVGQRERQRSVDRLPDIQRKESRKRSRSRETPEKRKEDKRSRTNRDRVEGGDGEEDEDEDGVWSN